MATDPDTLTDPAQLRQLMANAAAAGREDLVLACQVRIAKLAGQDYSDAIEREFRVAVTVAEELLSRANGRTTRLSRTRQKIGRSGVKRCVADLAGSSRVTDGFRLLLQHDRPELTAEAIVIRHADEFPAEVVAAAKQKLAQHGADVVSLAEKNG